MLKRREDYTPPAFLVTSVDMDIDIHDHETIVSTKLAVEPNPIAIKSETLYLDGRSLELKSIFVDGVKLRNDAFKFDDNGIWITGLTGQHIMKTIAICHPETNTALEGLYLSGGMYCTQCEPRRLSADWLFSGSPRCDDGIHCSYRS